MVIGLNVRRNQPQSSNCGLNVRSSNELSRLYCSGSRRYEAMNGNLYCVFSTEKYVVNGPKVRKKEGRRFENGVQGSKMNLSWLENLHSIWYTACGSLYIRILFF